MLPASLRAHGYGGSCALIHGLSLYFVIDGVRFRVMLRMPLTRSRLAYWLLVMLYSAHRGCLTGVLRFIRSIPFWRGLGKIANGIGKPGVRNPKCLGFYSILLLSRRARTERILVFSMRGLSRAYCHGGFSNSSTQNRPLSLIVPNSRPLCTNRLLGERLQHPEIAVLRTWG
jgi:hypothetical protein